MGKKYIIELEDKPVCVFDEDTQTFFPRLHRVKGFNSLVFDQNGLDKLTPYTEPDIDAKLKEEYKRGLNDAWGCMKEITHIVRDQGTMIDMFGCRTFGALLEQYTPGECIEKIRQHEQKEEIKVGDEVVGTYTSGEETEPFVIIREIPEIDPTYYFGIYSKSGEFCQGGLKLKKTGRHFPEIADVLWKMKETE